MSRVVQALTLPLIVAHFIRARWRWHYLRGARLRRYQERRARQIVAYAQKRSPFYRWHWAGHNTLRWRSLPPVNKQLMMDNFGRFNTRGVSKDEAMSVALRAETTRDFSPTVRGLTVGLSSGTSGHRGIFLANSTEQAAWAGTILARTLHRLRPRRLRVAFFLRSNSNLYEKVGGLLVQFRFFDLMLPVDEAVTELNSYRPHIVVGPPSLLGLMADAHKERRLRIEPERLVSVAEVLEPQDREYVESVFRAPVHQIYQCTEGLLAVSCARGSLHVQEDLVVLQMDPLPGDGQRATPIVTDLWRKTQPIIRYRLNDVLKMQGEPCPCGSPYRVIEAIEGRCDDICHFLTESGTRLFFPDTIRRMVLLASPQIRDYQAFQQRPGHLRLHLELPPDACFEEVASQVRASVEASMAQYACLPADIEIAQGLTPTTPGTKRRRVVNLQTTKPPPEQPSAAH
ncbi:MAG: adenylate cyclase [Chloroflexota bacterium]|nr:adenylate cyclase [Chloroflexota bacterium]